MLLHCNVQNQMVLTIYNCSARIMKRSIKGYEEPSKFIKNAVLCWHCCCVGV